jgi:gluconolactonase
VEVFRSPGEYPNGLTYDRQGRLLICEQKFRRLVRLEADSTLTVLADRWEGKALNCPNDVVVRRDSTIYFTDPYWKFPPGAVQELPFQGVFRINADGRLFLEAIDFDLPNGIALAPDEKLLYVGDSRRGKLYAFDIAPDGSLSGQRLLADLKSAEKGAVDGMKVDERGNIFTTGPGGIWVIDPKGHRLGRIRAPEIPANCAWGDPDYRALYLATPSSIYRLRTRVRGKATYNLSKRVSFQSF